MDNEKILETVEWMQVRWPKWKPDDEDLASWARLLGTVRSPSFVRDALLEHKDATDYNGPKKSAVRVIFGRSLGSRDAQEPLHDGHGGFWVQCVATEAQGYVNGPPRLLGAFQCVGYSRFVALPAPEVRAEHAHELRARCMGERDNRCYGGQWQVIREATYFQMLASMAAMQKAALARGEYPLRRKRRARDGLYLNDMLKMLAETMKPTGT